MAAKALPHWVQMLFGAAALATALLLGAPNSAPVAELSRAALRRPPELALHLALGALDGTGLAAEDARVRQVAPPPCLGDVCQPVVAVPGFEPRYGRPHRSELFVLALSRAHVEPLASIAWALTATGLRLDYTPVAFDGPNSGGHGWGSVWLRLRVRVDAHNAPVFPRRPR